MLQHVGKRDSAANCNPMSLQSGTILQDDNAGPHRARVLIDYLQNVGLERMEWPASSADLTPAEQLSLDVTNTTTLAIVCNTSRLIPQSHVTRLVTSWLVTD